MTPDDQSTRRSSKRPICGVTALWIAFVEAISLFLIGTASSMARWPYLQWPYLRWLYLWGSGQVFSSRNLLNLPRLSIKCVTDQFISALAKKEPVCIDYQPGKQEWLWYLLSLWCTRPLSLWCALSLQKLLPLSTGEHQAYETYYLYCKSIPSLQSFPRPSRSCGLPDRLIARNNRIAWSLSAKIERIQGYY